MKISCGCVCLYVYMCVWMCVTILGGGVTGVTVCPILAFFTIYFALKSLEVAPKEYQNN